MTSSIHQSTVGTVVVGEPVADQFGRVEVRGIDHIPEAERHGRPRELFMVWAAANVNYLYLFLGGLLVSLLGLDIRQGLVVVLVGNAFWLAIGYMAVSGPASGTPSSVVSRSMYGVLGNRVYVAVLNWPIFIAYEAINLAVGALAGFAVADQLGLSAGRPVQVVVVAVTAALTLVISVYGHATIVRMSGFFTVALTLVMVVLGGYVVAHASWDHGAGSAYAPTGWLLVATMLAGVTLIASAPLSWGISADYARYLPAGSSKRAVTAWTALGGFFPSVLLGGLGVLAGSAVDMTDPQTNLAGILPEWFYVLFLVFVVLGSITNNILTMYSSGLCLQAIGIPLKRSASVLIDGVLGVTLASYALFVSNFTDTLSNALQATVALLGPTTAVYVTDMVLRRNRYDGLALHRESPDSPFWFHRGTNLAGFAAVLVGTTLAALCLYTTSYQGPISRWLGGADVSSLVGPLVATVVYAGLVKLLYPAHVQAKHG